jgi:hypothetical protein
VNYNVEVFEITLNKYNPYECEVCVKLDQEKFNIVFDIADNSLESALEQIRETVDFSRNLPE